jgi:hypothetical protein
VQEFLEERRIEKDDVLWVEQGKEWIVPSANSTLLDLKMKATWGLVFALAEEHILAHELYEPGVYVRNSGWILCFVESTVSFAENWGLLSTAALSTGNPGQLWKDIASPHRRLVDLKSDKPPMQELKTKCKEDLQAKLQPIQEAESKRSTRKKQKSSAAASKNETIDVKLSTSDENVIQRWMMKLLVCLSVILQPGIVVRDASKSTFLSQDDLKKFHAEKHLTPPKDAKPDVLFLEKDSCPEEEREYEVGWLGLC